VRRALGLGKATPQRDNASTREGGHGRERGTGGRRFAREGDVPVVHLRGADSVAGGTRAPSGRVAALEAELTVERAAREVAERALKEAHAALQNLQTKLAHAEFSHAESLATERARREAAEVALVAAEHASRAPMPAEPATPEEPRVKRRYTRRAKPTEVAQLPLEPPPPQKPAVTAKAQAKPAPKVEETPTPRRVGRPRKPRPVEPEVEQEPVQWWLPSYRAKARRR
jgi:hypothetical protein